MGHIITDKGIKPDNRKVSAIKLMKTPKDKKELKRFLGMISYLSKFLPSMSSTTECLRRLVHPEAEWKWTADHEQTF